MILRFSSTVLGLLSVLGGLGLGGSQLPAPASSPQPDPNAWITAVADEDSVALGGSSTATADPGSGDPAGQLYDYRRIPVELCAGDAAAQSSRTCVADISAEEFARTCPDGTPALDPVYRARLNPQAEVIGPYEWYQDDPCPADAQPGVVLSVEDFRRLPLVASVASYQPATGTGLVNMELIVFTDPAPQVLQTTVLGTPVTVQATPTGFSWDFGDGTEPLVTTDPGGALPAVSGVPRLPGAR